MSAFAPLMIGTVVSHNSEILVSRGNPVYSAQAGGTGTTPSALAS